ncbi:MAG TPA: amidohydrolase [Pseudolabrys sp.]|nr:amidohydrolase [Pseudolabrys sp.]
MLSAGVAQAQTADAILFNGKIVTLDGPSAVVQALAIRDGRVLAAGENEKIEKLADVHTKRVDLGGRTVIPGLIDSHIHAIRAGLTFATTLDWTGIATIKNALETIRQAAHGSPPGHWIAVVGDWNKSQFAERRAPTPQELAQAAPDNPVYVQHLYDFAVLNPAATKALGITAQSKVPPAGKIVLDAEGRPTGVIEAGGNVPTLARLYGRLPKATFAEEVKGTRAFFRTLNRFGVTGIIDEGGGGLFPANYQPLFTVWRNGDLTLRVRFDLMSQHRGKEFADLKDLTQMLPPRFGDDKLRFLGLGEVPIWGMHDGSLNVLKPFNPSAEAKQHLLELASWAAQHAYTVHIHASSDHSASQILDIFEQINKTTPIAKLRWQIAHIEDASDDTLRRMKALGMGWAVQDRLYYGGEYIKSHGEKTLRRAPPIVTAMRMGLVVSGGTDAIAVSPYNPFLSLYWELTGKTVSGAATRAAAEIPSRVDALQTYTINGAWMSFEEGDRGSLAPGKLADLAVLDRDYLSVPVEDVAKTQSLLTLVGGHAVYAAGPFAALEKKL